MIKINSVSKSFGDFTAIEDINFEVENSSIYGLVGYNGAGKTTLLKMCAGILKPTKGFISMDNQNVYDNGAVRADRKSVV